MGWEEKTPIRRFTVLVHVEIHVSEIVRVEVVLSIDQQTR